MPEADAIIAERVQSLLPVFGILLAAGLAMDFLWVTGIMSRRLKPPAISPLVQRSPWGWRDGAIVVLALLLAHLAAQAVMRAAEARGWMDEALPSHFHVLAAVIVFHIPILLASAWVIRARGLTADSLGLSRRAVLKDLSQGVALYLAAWPVVALAAVVYHALLAKAGEAPKLQPVVNVLLDSEERSAWMQGLLCFLSVTVVPAAEEVLFRGIALPVLARRTGLAPAILIISLVFAWLHLAASSSVPLFVLSVGLCLAYACSGRILVPIAMHATFNLISIAVLTMGTL